MFFVRGVIKKTGIILAVIVGAFAILVAVLGIYAGTNEKPNNLIEIKKMAQQSEMPSEKPSQRADMLEGALSAVVGISSAENTQKNGESEWFMGSGIIATSDGYIITNHHVIGRRPERIVVTLKNGEVIEGKTIWSSSALDLAVVKIDGSGYPTLPLGDAKKLRVGEGIVAIGNPLSLQFERTVTAGIVSALGRSINIETDSGLSYMEDLIQTDASINPGNSGGPLINENGEVVGINTIKVSTAEGMGFAVPINVCVPIISRLKSVGEFKTPYLGLYAYTPAAARYSGQNVNFDKGLFISRVDFSGPAFSAGLRVGDVIKSINGAEVNSMLELREELFKRQSGEITEIEFLRDNSRRKVNVMLSSTD